MRRTSRPGSRRTCWPGRGHTKNAPRAIASVTAAARTKALRRPARPPSPGPAAGCPLRRPCSRPTEAVILTTPAAPLRAAAGVPRGTAVRRQASRSSSPPDPPLTTRCDRTKPSPSGCYDSLLLRSALLLGVLAAFGCARTPIPPAPQRPSSVLLVTVDTLRADRLGSYGDAAARTPAMDALASSGVLFDHAYTPAPITLPAHTSILTGLAPPAHGVRAQRRLRARPRHPDPRGGAPRPGPGHRRLHRRLPPGPALRPRARVRCLRRRDGQGAGCELRVRGAPRQTRSSPPPGTG